jgi:NAD(P)-dependent dehydrogenase (short-subunit alcohol dehydrogenase family)
MCANDRSSFDLDGKVALVTGGGSGLGREFCDALAEYGADIICADIDRGRAEETCEIIKKYGHIALPIEADVSKYNQVQTMFQHVEIIFGRLDILINNAGIAAPSRMIDQIDINDWHKVLDIDINGAFYCMREGLRIMLKQATGSIVNIASVLGLRAVDPEIVAAAPYVTSKFAVVGLTKQGAAEYGKHGIRINCIAPGWYPGTRLGEGKESKRPEAATRAWQQMLAARTPMKKTGEPSDLRGLIVFLASDSSSFMTGAVITNDGGWTCW